MLRYGETRSGWTEVLFTWRGVLSRWFKRRTQNKEKIKK